MDIEKVASENPNKISTTKVDLKDQLDQEIEKLLNLLILMINKKMKQKN